jgi:hypothetical protein
MPTNPEKPRSSSIPAENVRSVAFVARLIAAISSLMPLDPLASARPPGRRTSPKRGPSMMGLSVT